MNHGVRLFFVLYFVALLPWASASDRPEPMIEGTWLFYLTVPDIPPFQELLTFSRTGQALTSFQPASDAPPQPVRWGEFRPHAGHFDYTAYTVITTDINSGFLRDNCVMKLVRPDAIEATCHLDWVDGSGVVLPITDFTAVGKRLPLVPLG